MKRRLILVIGDHSGGPGYIIDSLFNNLNDFDEIIFISLKSRKLNIKNKKYNKKIKKVRFYGFFNSVRYLLISSLKRKDKNIIFAFDNLGFIYGLFYKILTNSLFIIRISGFVGPVSWKYYYINKLIVNYFADKVVVNTKSLKKHIRGLFPKSQPIVIYNGIKLIKSKQLNNFSSPIHYGSKDINIIHLANFYNSIKGHKSSLEIVKRLLNKGINVQLNFVGDGVLLRSIEELSNEMDISENVNFLGYLGDSKKINQIRKNDICLNPSFTESFGIGVLECMRQGLPVVGSNVPGFNEVVLTNYNGILCDKNKVSTFVDAIEFLINNPDVYKQYSFNSKKRSFLFSEERMIISYKKLFNQLLK